MHLRSLKKTKKDVSLHDPIGTDKEGNEFTLALYPFESPSRVRRALLVLCTSASLQCGVSLISMSAKKPRSRHVSHFPCMGMPQSAPAAVPVSLQQVKHTGACLTKT
jgi:hypothetical protein